MTPIRTVVVDDEPLARQTLHQLLHARPGIQVVGSCGDGAEAVDVIRREAPDLVFLDVQMPEVSGFEVVERIGVDRMPALVFVTAYDRHALQAFEVHALDYLLKPFDDERFNRTVDHVLDHLHRPPSSLDALVHALETRDTPGASPDRLLIKEQGRMVFLPISEIDYVEAAGDYMVIHAGGTRHLLRETMQRLTQRLSGPAFVRIHRSTLVRVDRIRELRPQPSGDYDVRLHDGTSLRLSRRYWDDVEALLV
ncbi:MAG: response regulator [Bacteroidota bacterium]